MNVDKVILVFAVLLLVAGGGLVYQGTVINQLNEQNASFQAEIGELNEYTGYLEEEAVELKKDAEEEFYRGVYAECLVLISTMLGQRIDPPHPQIVAKCRGALDSARSVEGHKMEFPGFDGAIPVPEQPEPDRGSEGNA